MGKGEGSGNFNVFAKEKLFSGLAKEIAIKRTFNVVLQEKLHRYCYITILTYIITITFNYTCNFVESTVYIVIVLSVANPGTVRDSQLR